MLPNELHPVRRPPWTRTEGPGLPVMPWIMPSVPPEWVRLFETHGTPGRRRARERIFAANEPIDRLVLLTSGLSGRCFGSPANQSLTAMALSVPGRLAGGNHNFWSARAGNGRYFAITDIEYLSLPHGLVKRLAAADPVLSNYLSILLELSFQSDRIGFATIALLPVRSRLLMFYLTWAFIYGRLEPAPGRPGGGEVLYHVMPGQKRIADVISASTIQVKRSVAALQREGLLSRTSPGWRLASGALDEVWRWLCSNEESGAVIRRAADWRVHLSP